MLSTKLQLIGRKAGHQCVSRGFATGKEIAFGTEARAAMLRGVDMLADAVQTTLGPKVSRRTVLTQPPSIPVCFEHAGYCGCAALALHTAAGCQSTKPAASFSVWACGLSSDTRCHHPIAGPERCHRAVLWPAEDHKGRRDCCKVDRVRGQVPQPGRAAGQRRGKQDQRPGR